MSRGRSAGLALASGVLLALSFPGPGLWPLALLAYAPLLLALDRASPRRAAALGWLMHTTFSLIVFRFLWTALRDHGGLALPTAAAAMLLLAALQGLRGAALGLAVALGRGRLSLPGAFALAHLAAEHVPVVFSWSLSATIHDQLALVQAAALGGAPLVAVMVASFSLLPATLVARQQGRPWPLRWGIAPAACLALSAALGAWRVAALDRDDPATADDRAGAPGAGDAWLAGVVHGAIELTGPDVPPVEGWGDLQRAHRSLESQGARLIVWPETAAPFPVRSELPYNDLSAQLAPLSPRAAVVGAVVEGPGGATNSALLVEAGRVAWVYSKRELLPFGEYVPMERWLPWLRVFSPRTARLRAPEGDSLLLLDGRGVGLSICYEGVLPGRVSEAAAGAQLLVNLTNDAWFAGTSEPALHLALTRLRAVEQGRYLLRSTNQGVSVIVAPSGRLLARAEGPPTRPLRARVRWQTSLTPFARWGEGLAWVWALGFWVLGGWAPFTTLWRRCQGVSRNNL